MESSGSDDEEDRVSVRRRDQIDRKAQEDDYYRFVSDLSDEDYILMRDNNLLGPPGESTEEESMRRLQLMKENLPQNSDENPDRGDANVTSEQKEIPSWKEESPISANSDKLRFGLERNLDPDDKNSNPENECVASAKLPRREDTEDSQRQVESPQSESLFTRPSTPEQDMTETLMEVPPTRSQRRLRSRSPVYRRTRARTDSSSPPHSLWEIFPSINEDIPSQTFKQPLISENERFSRTGHEESLRQQMPGHELQNRDLIKTSKTRNAVHEECDSDTTCSSESWEVTERNPTTPFNLEVGRVHYQACSQRDSRVSRTQLTSDSPNNTTTSEIEQEELTPMFSHSEEANESASVNTIRNPVHRILNTSLSDTTSVPTQSTLWQTMTGFSNSSNLMDSDRNLEHSVSPPSENIERAESPNERHGPSGSESRPGSASNARYDPDSSLIVIPDSSPCSISSSASSSSLIVISDSSPYSISSSAPSPILISSSAPSPILISSSAPSPILISSSAPSPILISSSAPSPILISSSNDEDSETSSLILVESEERSLSTGLSEAGQEGGRMTPIIIDDSDSGSSLNLDEVILLTEADPPQTTGLTTTQIDNLPLRYFGENEEFKACIICITEYTEGNTLRILPCSHEFHDHCIDHWLAEHITCPICRGPVVDPPEADNSM